MFGHPEENRMRTKKNAALKVEGSLDFLLREWDWGSRIAKCAQLGIEGVEFPDWSNHDPQLTEALLRKYGVELVVLAGDRWVGDYANTHVQYSVTDRRNHECFIRDLDEALNFARACNVRNVLLDTGDAVAGMRDHEMMRNVVEALGPAADKVRECGMGVLIEPLNRNEHKGYFLYSIDRAAELVNQIGSGAKLLVDIFHSTKEEGTKLPEKLLAHKMHLGEVIHVADTPHRHEPGTGDIDWPRVMKAISDVEFNGWIGLEFVPTKRSEEASLIVDEN
jgi:hydroxypyruvate isomerase